MRGQSLKVLPDDCDVSELVGDCDGGVIERDGCRHPPWRCVVRKYDQLILAPVTNVGDDKSFISHSRNVQKPCMFVEWLGHQFIVIVELSGSSGKIYSLNVSSVRLI